ncbi:diguanylate cyclase/phosphodiesterase with PAS/PAC sensor(s) [Ferrimonas balearica DSM 9799]|uniref:cyclic-guanylate-specific phosphodiesterase n=1 Tax=Ferrimonas balearica (strain DSM 9799 / CCM 4581 / KCTC 23876 / PAT) TaxID=550540 RepID=E1SQ56_FERBD|nr:EAL domain-containing protein [Ferrimonas balearica]ADN76828.1 diguanylate cyclase/phosphodiesterase with PAS/PAC sensor(s) [Ferrimonas balearica DSM 9799]
MKPWIALLLLCICLTAGASERQLTPTYNLSYYGLEHNLSESSVTSIVQDPTGFIWAGTINGLNRLDGDRFRQYNSANVDSHGLANSTIRDLQIDEQGHMWVLTRQNIYRYHFAADRFEVLELPSDSSYWSLRVRRDTLFIGTESSIIEYNVRTRTYKEYRLLLGSNNGIRHVEITGEHTLLVSEFKGQTYELDIQSGQFSEVEVPGQLNAIIDYNGVNYAATDVGLFKIGADHVSQQQWFTGNVIHIAKNRSENTLYFISDKSLYTLKESESGEVQVNKAFDFDATAQSLYIDTDDNLWVGLVGLGLAKVNSPESALTHYQNICDAPGCNQIWSLETHNNKVWLANETNQLVAFSADLSIAQQLDIGINGAKSLHRHLDKLYVTGENGLSIVDASDSATHLEYRNTIFTSMASAGSELYIGTFSKGILRLEPDLSLDDERLSPQLTSTVLTLTIDGDRMLIGSQRGVHIYQFEPDLNLWVQRANLLKDKIITAIDVLSHGLLVGTVGEGFFLIDENNKPSKVRFNLPKEKEMLVYSMSSNGNSAFASTSSGIVEIDKTSLNVVNFYDEAYGAQAEFNGMSSLSTEQFVFFGGTEGFNRLELAKRQIDKSISPPKFTSFRVFNQEVQVGDKLKQNIVAAEQVKLKYSDYPFSFYFTSLESNLSGLITYDYRLEGLSENWIPTDINQRFATFTNIPHGEYTLEVRASIPFIDGSAQTSSLNVIITPPWWLSRYAKLAYGAAILALVLVVYREFLRRQRVQARIAQSEERLKLSLWGSGDEMWDWDMEAGRIYRSNIWGILEFPRDGKRSSGAESNIHPDDVERVNQLLSRHFSGDSDHFEATYRVKSKLGDWVWILDRAKIVERDDQDRPTRMTGTIKDISSIKEAEERLNLFARALRNISEGMFILDDDMRYLEVNEACLEITGFEKEHFVNETLKFDRYPQAYTDDIIRIVQQQGRWNGELELSRSNGRLIQIELTLDQIKESGTHNHFYVGVFSDITHRKQAESELRRLTNNDILTGLPNRSYLQISLDSLVRRQVPLCLLIFDLDNFKKVNDSLGHGAGDALLCHVANRVRNHLPEQASLYRLGGDEFAVIFDGDQAINYSTKLAQEILAAFSQPFQLEQGEVVVNSSIGIVTFPDDDVDRQALLRKADLAMYHAKGQGGQCYQFFNESLNQAAMERLDTENLIRQALKDNHFEVYYQPKVDLPTKQIKGMEALVRLNHPTRGLISPGEFIPLAEETGLIVEIGEHVLKQACFAAEKWRQMGLLKGRVAVNLSSQQFILPDLCERIERILKLTRLPADWLELEITEGTVIQQPEQAIATMRTLNQLGIHLALDDFGTGYSSLSYLKRFPINTLKIDKSFVDDIAITAKDRMMAASIITIARNMELSVVAEGVEEKAQLSVLEELRCDMVQGYLFSRPIPEMEFESLMFSQSKRPIYLSQESVT